MSHGPTAPFRMPISPPMEWWINGQKITPEHKAAHDRIEALEAALADALSGLRYVRANYPHVTGVGFDRCEGYQSLIGADTK